MKPSWDEAPKWAQWLAMDNSGIWFWFQTKPTLKTRMQGSTWIPSGPRWCKADVAGAEKTLEERPT